MLITREMYRAMQVCAETTENVIDVFGYEANKNVQELLIVQQALSVIAEGYARLELDAPIEALVQRENFLSGAVENELIKANTR